MFMSQVDENEKASSTHMVSETPAPPSSPRIAVFDLDGTLTRVDTFLPFLVTFAFKRRMAWRIVVIPFVVLAYLLKLLRDHQAKQLLMRFFLGGQTRDQIDRHASEFSRTWVGRRLHPLCVERLRHHQEQGDRVVIVSASPDVYVPEVARLLGVEETVCTRVKWDNDRCLGTIDGKNCKREAKIEMLVEYLGEDAAPEHMISYGDSRSDLPLLRWVREGYLIGKYSCRKVDGEAG